MRDVLPEGSKTASPHYTIGATRVPFEHFYRICQKRSDSPFLEGSSVVEPNELARA